jgi:hypothetical protein
VTLPRKARWILAGAAFVLAVIGAWLYFNLLGPARFVWRAEIREGNRLVSDIEKYRHDRNGLPSGLEDIGRASGEQGPFYYEKCSDDRYIVWFGTTLGESVTYDSISRDWTDVGGGCR